MAFGSLLTGIVAPLIVHSIISGKRMSQQGGVGVDPGTVPPNFHVNFYNQDENHNEDRNDVKDNGNLNHQQGNSHLTAHGNIHNLQRAPMYPYPMQHPRVPSSYTNALPPYPYYNPYSYLGPLKQPNLSLRYPDLNRSTIWPQNPPLSPLYPLFYPMVNSIPLNVSQQIDHQLKKTSMIIQRLLQTIERKEDNQNLAPSLASNKTNRVFDDLLDLAQDPMYGLNKTHNLNSTSALTPLKSVASKLSRKKRADYEGNN